MPQDEISAQVMFGRSAGKLGRLETLQLAGAAAALATLETIEEDGLVSNAEARGQQLRDGIMACGNPLFVSVRGRGLLDAVELAHPCAHAAMNWVLEHGLIVNAVAPDALRLVPPLVVTEQDIDQAISILAKIPTDLPND